MKHCHIIIKNKKSHTNDSEGRNNNLQTLQETTVYTFEKLLSILLLPELIML